MIEVKAKVEDGGVSVSTHLEGRGNEVAAEAAAIMESVYKAVNKNDSLLGTLVLAAFLETVKEGDDDDEVEVEGTDDLGSIEAYMKKGALN